MEEDEKYRASGSEQQLSKKERANANNTQNVKNAADIAMATKNPYAMAAGAAVKAADKITGGKSSEALGKAVTKATKMVPGSQKVLNKINESGAGDKAAKIASMKNGKTSSTGKSAASNNKLPEKKESSAPKEALTKSSDDGQKKDGLLKKQVKKKLILKLLVALIPVILYILLFAIIILIIFADDESGDTSPHLDEYYDFNLTQVYSTNDYVNEDDKIIYDSMSLEEFVKGAIYARLNGQIPDLNENKKLDFYKAYMIIMKAEVLAYGDYTATDKELIINSTNNGIPYCDFRNGCDIYQSGSTKTYVTSAYEDDANAGEYTISYDALSKDEIELLNEAYEDTKYLILAPSTLEEPLSSYPYDLPELTSGIDTVILQKASNGKSYKNIISSLSTFSDFKIYDLEEYAMIYEYVENTEYWWPIGSSSPTTGNIYGGTPAYTGISSYFGMRLHPVTGVYKMHSGIDIAAAMNSNIIATRSGTVYATGYNSSAGNYIYIDHGDGVMSFYCHIINGGILVNEGQSVTQGQRIGLVGTTGSSTGYHLHFEIQVNGSAVNPLDYVDPDNPRPVAVTSSTVEGSTNTQTVCLSLKASGYSNNAVAGIMANIHTESAFNPHALGDSGTSYGLCQWHNSRWTSLKNYCGGSYTEIGCQLSYLTHELQSSYYSVYSYLKGNNSAYNMAYYYCVYFEVPANRYTQCANRASSNASSYLSYAQNGCN